MDKTAQDIIADGKLSAWQIAAIAITIGLNALDGFDVLSISFASPGIAREWGIERGALGIVLSMELLGMALGSIFLGGVADRIGRRPTILGCLVVMAIGMYMAAHARGVTDLSLWRVLTGLGIGGMLAAINAVAAECANNTWRKLSMALMVIGYPLGAVIGGTIAQSLLKSGSWRDVFTFGAIVTACFIPLVWFFVPETVAYLAQRQPVNALSRINAVLSRFGHPRISTLTAPAAATRKFAVLDVFSPALRRVTILLTMAYSFHVVTFYFMLKWVPKIVTDMGFDPSQAAGVLVYANIGGALGGALFGLAAQRFGLKWPTLIVMVMSSLMVIIFGRGQADLQAMKMVVLGVGLFTNSAIVGLYSIFAEAFPTHVRATGTGVAIGAGRGFSWAAPVIAGFLFQGGLGLPSVAVIMAMGSLFAAAALYILRLERLGVR